MLRRIVYSTLLVTLLAACSSKEAVDTAAVPAPTPTEATADRDQPGQAGVKVFVDPATGEIRDPTPEELAAISRNPAAKPTAPTATRKPAREIHLPDGTVAVEMEQNEEPLKACRDDDGNVVVSHDCASAKDPHP